jgi:glycosyltransferase involved in cell wall biosynthesis
MQLHHLKVVTLVKILYLSFDPGIPYLGTKGASIHIREFTRALREAGHQIEVAVARMGASAENVDGVHELPEIKADLFEEGQGWGDPKLIAEARSFARNFAPWAFPSTASDLVYERYSLFGIAGLTLARQRKAPFVLEVNSPLVEEDATYRGLVMKPLAGAIEQYLFSQADCIIAVSEVVRNYVCSIAPNAHVEVLPNGVDAALFSRATPDAYIREKLGKDRFLIGFSGSLKPWHGLESLLHAFRSLAKEGFGLVIVGDGPLHKPLLKEVEKSNLGDSVILTGAVEFEQVPRILKTLDAVAAPYPEMANFYFSPLKIFEYMASGRPIVASGIGQTREVLQDERNALLVPPGDTDALIRGFKRLKDDPFLGQRLGQTAQKDVQESHTWAMRVKTIELVFSALANQSNVKSTARVG